MNFQNPLLGEKKMRPPKNLPKSTLQSLKKTSLPKSLTLHPGHSKCPKPIHWTVQLPSSLSLVELHHVGSPSQHGGPLEERRRSPQSWLSCQGGPAGTTLTPSMAVKRVVPDASRGTKVAQTNNVITPTKKISGARKKVLRKIGVKDDDGQAHGEKRTGREVVFYV